MIRGVGVDVCAVARIDAAYTEFGPRFLARLLTPTERAQRTWEAPALARRWACKEAVAKACATGIGAAVGFQEIEITYAANGAPLCQVRGQAGQFLVSVSDDAGVATAFAIWSDA